MARIPQQPKRAPKQVQQTPGQATTLLLHEQPQVSAPPRLTTPLDITMLQRSIGNRTVTQLLARQHVALAQPPATTIQRHIAPNKLNIVGEHHTESDARRADEKTMISAKSLRYWQESEFTYKVGKETMHGDNRALLVLQSISFILSDIKTLAVRVTLAQGQLSNDILDVQDIMNMYRKSLKSTLKEAIAEVEQLRLAIKGLELSGFEDDALIDQAGELREYLALSLEDQLESIEEDEHTKHNQRDNSTATLNFLSASIGTWQDGIAKLLQQQNYDLAVFAPTSPGEKSTEAQLEKQLVGERSQHMFMTAEAAAQHANITGVWKVGQEHVADMHGQQSDLIVITSQEEFNTAYQAWKKTKAAEPVVSP